MKKYIEDITRWREHMKFIFEWKNISRVSAANSEIFFPREDKLHMFKQTCNFRQRYLH